MKRLKPFWNKVLTQLKRVKKTELGIEPKMLKRLNDENWVTAYFAEGDIWTLVTLSPPSSDRIIIDAERLLLTVEQEAFQQTNIVSRLETLGKFRCRRVDKTPCRLRWPDITLESCVLRDV